MASALKLAEKGRGRTNPNPMVGAVLVKNNKIISKGYHKAYGNDHAEAVNYLLICTAVIFSMIKIKNPLC